MQRMIGHVVTGDVDAGRIVLEVEGLGALDVEVSQGNHAWLNGLAIADHAPATGVLRELFNALHEHCALANIAWLHAAFDASAWFAAYAAECAFKRQTRLLHMACQRVVMNTWPAQPAYAIVTARSDNLDAIMKLDALALAPEFWLPRRWHAMQQAALNTHVVFDDATGLAGYAQVETNETAMHLVRLAVHPNLRRHGVARALLSHVSKLGIGSLTLNTPESAEAARAMYESLGFVMLPARADVWSRQFGAK